MEHHFERDLSPLGRIPSTVTTLYHAHNSNLFKSSESSVQITSAVIGQGNSNESKTSQNFCELDIVSRREKERSVITVNNEPQKCGGVFRKTICDKDNKSGVLCLVNLVKDVDEDYCKPIISKTREKDDRPIFPRRDTDDFKDPKQKQIEDFLKLKEYEDILNHLRQNGKEVNENVSNGESSRMKSRSVSRKRRTKGRSPTSKSVDPRQLKIPSDEIKPEKNSIEEPTGTKQSTSSEQIPLKFVDLVQARMMYFVDLPSQSETKRKPKSKHVKNNEPSVVEKEDPKLGHIYVNKVEGEYPTMSSLNTESSIPIKLKPEASFTSLIAVKRKEKRHNNSPQPEESSTAHKINKEVKRKSKHKKKCKPSLKRSFITNAVINQMRQEAINLNCDFVPCKEEKLNDEKVEVLYKNKTQKNRNSEDIKCPNHHDGDKKSNKHKRKSPAKDGKLNEKPEKTVEQLIDKIRKDKSPKHVKKDKRKNADVTLISGSTSGNKSEETKVDTNPKNLKTKGPSHKSRRSSPVCCKGCDCHKAETDKCRTGSLPTQNKDDVHEKSQKRKHARKKSKESKNVREIRSFSHEPRNHLRDKREQLQFKDLSPKISEKERKIIEEKKNLTTNVPTNTPRDKKEKVDDDTVVSVFLGDDSFTSDSRIIIPPEQEIKTHLAKLISNKCKVIAERTYQKEKNKPVKICSCNDCSESSQKNDKRKNSKPLNDQTKPSVDNVEKESLPKPLFDSPSLSIIKTLEETCIQMPTSILKQQSQRVETKVPVNHYMGYFMPSQVAEKFSRRNVTPHSVIPEILLSTKSPENTVKFKRSRSCVPTKVIEPPEKVSPSKSHSKVSSDTQLGGNSPRKQRSRSVVTKENPYEVDKATLATMESREHLQRELKRLQMLQQNDKQKWFSIKGPTGINRLKSRLPSNEDQEVFLNVPICHTENMSTSNSITNSDLSAGVNINTVLKLQSPPLPTPEEEPCHPEDERKYRREMQQGSPRREISLSELNLQPMVQLYPTPRSEKHEAFHVNSGGAKKNVSRCTVYSDISERLDCSTNYNQGERKLQYAHIILGEKIVEVCNKAIDVNGKVVEGCTVSGIEPPKKLKYEKYTSLQKSVIMNNLRMMFFPPTQITNIDIQPKETYVYGVFVQPGATSKSNLSNSSNTSDKSIISKDSLEKPSANNCKNETVTKSPVQVKTKRKLLPFESIKKKSKGPSVKKMCEIKLFNKFEGTPSMKSLSKIRRSLSSLFLEANSSDDKSQIIVEKVIEPVCKKLPKKSSTSRQDIRSLSRINSAVKMMESSLQIIKEESQSTDSSAQKTDKKEKVSITDFKQTQTELVTNDMEKMKEVISYLYLAFDRKESNNAVNCLQDPRDIVTKLEIKQEHHISSTESSSYYEQFKNMVKNVKPKFTTLKRMSKPEIPQNSSSSVLLSGADGALIPTKSIFSKINMSSTTSNDTCAIMGSKPQESSTSLINRGRLYCSSDSRFLKNINSPLQKRTNSAEHVGQSQFQSYSPNRDFSNLRTSKSIHIGVDKQDKGICTDFKPELKSSTSISDFSSVIVSISEGEKARLLEEATPPQVETPSKMVEDKSIQCMLTENGDCQSENVSICDSIPEDKIKLEKAPQDNENPNIKIFENKSLQTSAGIPQPKPVLQDETNMLDNEIFYDTTPKVSLHTFGSHNCPRHQRKHSGSSHSLSVTKMSRKYKNRRDFEKSFRLSKYEKACKNEGKSFRTKQAVEVDYVNLLRLERHLEQVLGLYPTVCKAIRAHMEQARPTPEKYCTKDRKKILLTSQDTLATTVDTITEYNVMESDNNVTGSSQFKQYRNINFPLNKYLYENHFKFQNRNGDRKNRSKYSLFASSGRSSSNNFELIEPSTPYPYTDTSSSSSKLREYTVLQYNKESKSPRWSKYKAKRHRKGDFNFYNSMFSDDIRDNWSIGSPLYSISTPSLSISKNEFMMKTKSKSLTTTQVLTSRLSTSKSLIELCSNKTLNRKAMIYKLKEDLSKGGKGKSFRLGTQQVFLLSLNSQTSPNTSPSKLFLKAEHDRSERTVSKITEVSEPKVKIDETNCYNLLFSGNASKNKIDEKVNDCQIVKKRPFYIHHRQSSSSEMDFLDSIEKEVQRKSEEEDLGNFSADSLESACSPSGEEINYTMDLLQNNLVPPKQNFFVYTSTVNYTTNAIKNETKAGKTTPASRPSSRNSTGRNSHKGTYSKTGSVKSNPSKKGSSTSKKAESSLTSNKVRLNVEANNKSQISAGVHKTTNDDSNTLISESGYETSNKTKPTASIKNFFKKGGSLLDIFRHSGKPKPSGNPETVKQQSSNTNLTNFSSLYSKNQPENRPDVSATSTNRHSQDEDDQSAPTSNTKMYWSNVAQNMQSQKVKITFLSPNKTKEDKEDTNKATSTTANKKCSVTSGKLYEKQKCACHEYAEKVVQESQMKKEGYEKQYRDFEEIPLELLIGRKVPLPFRKVPPIAQMNAASENISKSTKRSDSLRYPYYESDHILNDMQPFVTITDDKIVFKSSRTNMKTNGYKSKPTSPSRGIQAKPIRQRGSVHDICYRMNGSWKSGKQDVRIATPDTPKSSPKSSRKRKANSDLKKKDSDKLNSNNKKSIFRRKRSASLLGCRCDIEDDSPDSTTVTFEPDSNRSDPTEEGDHTEDDVTENQLSEEKPPHEEPISNIKKSKRKITCKCQKEVKIETEDDHKTGISRGTEPLLRLSCFKKKRTAETQMKRLHKTKATGPVEELDGKKMCTKGTHMKVKPFQKTEGTEPMPTDRISTSTQQTQMEGATEDKVDSLDTRSGMIVTVTTVPRSASEEYLSSIGEEYISEIDSLKRPIETQKPWSAMHESTHRRGIARETQTPTMKGFYWEGATDRETVTQDPQMDYEPSDTPSAKDDQRDYDVETIGTVDIIVDEKQHADIQEAQYVRPWQPFVPLPDDERIQIEEEHPSRIVYTQMKKDIAISRKGSPYLSESQYLIASGTQNRRDSQDRQLTIVFEKDKDENYKTKEVTIQDPLEYKEHKTEAGEIKSFSTFDSEISSFNLPPSEHEQSTMRTKSDKPSKGSHIKAVKSESFQSYKAMQPVLSSEVYFRPQEELLDDDDDDETGTLSRKESINSAKVVDSLTVMQKMYKIGKVNDNSDDKTPDRPRTVGISDVPVIHIIKEDGPSPSKVKLLSIRTSDEVLVAPSMQSPTASIHSCASFIDTVMNEVVEKAFNQYAERIENAEKTKEDLALTDAELLTFADKHKILDEDLPHMQELDARKQASEELRKGLTDKEVFDKLLTSFEKEDEIAVRLSKDETFFKEQIEKLKKDSDESLPELTEKNTGGENIYADDLTDKHRSTHFWEEKMKAMRAKEDNPVKTDDIGTCFARGFRPDNIALSGDACFNLNKQDKIKFTKGMLTNEESIIDFSERETPLDYLLALGFMVDEASNALKDDDIRSRLLAAITEARVWINKITTTQGTLLYLVAYKSRPKTMRYFLQLVEAIINKRINNAIKLDGFLRVLEKVEEGEIQMINILGADKFEDEENEEKIVKKQLRQLFITVYKIAEKEAQQKGNNLSQQAVVLLRILAAKYRAGLHPHLELIARYIGQDLLNTETQLEAAMIFLSRLDTAEVKLKEFEAYCDIKCEKKKKMKHLESTILDDMNDKIDTQQPVIQDQFKSMVDEEDIEVEVAPIQKEKGGKKVTHLIENYRNN